MAGECKKLTKPFAVLRRRERSGDVDMEMEMDGVSEEEEKGDGEELEIVEVVRYKIVFSSRPEPVGRGEEGG